MSKRASLMVTAAFAACMIGNHASAGPSDYLHMPNIETGEREIELHYGVASGKNSPKERGLDIGFGYGVNEYWKTELVLKYKREPNDLGRQHTFHDAYEWENVFALTDPGKYGIDVGFLLEIERPLNHAEGWEVKFGPLLQTEFDKLQLNLNLFAERSFKAEEGSHTVFQYQWQAKYRLSKAFECGLQGMGEPYSHERKTGPAIFGKLPLGAHQALKYNAAYLVGNTRETPDHTFRMTLEIEF